MHLPINPSHLSYIEVYLLTLGWFFVLYFGWASAFGLSCRWLASRGILHRIRAAKTDVSLKREMGYSLLSMLIFGFSGVAMLAFMRLGWARLSAPTVGNVLFGLLILTLWNEVHFYGIHRLLHQPWFYRKVHYIHHQSKIPGVYSVYSFHPLEALLLSTVPLFIMPLYDFSLPALILFPLVSITFNLAGHSSYRFGQGDGQRTHELATRHADHHYRNKGGFGFIFPYLDHLFNSRKK